MPFYSGLELPGRWGIFDEPSAPGVPLVLRFGVIILVVAWLGVWMPASLPSIGPVARMGPPALKPLVWRSLKPILSRECGALDCPEVGAPKCVFRLVGPATLICRGPPEAAIVGTPPRFEALPSLA